MHMIIIIGMYVMMCIYICVLSCMSLTVRMTTPCLARHRHAWLSLATTRQVIQGMAGPGLAKPGQPMSGQAWYRIAMPGHTYLDQA